MGLISGILGIAALIMLWNNPISVIWWILLILLIFDFLTVEAVKWSIKMYGLKDMVTKFWAIIATVIQVSIIIFFIYYILIK